jgi:hypothetical protein
MPSRSEFELHEYVTDVGCSVLFLMETLQAVCEKMDAAGITSPPNDFRERLIEFSDRYPRAHSNGDMIHVLMRRDREARKAAAAAQDPEKP